MLSCFLNLHCKMSTSSLFWSACCAFFFVITLSGKVQGTELQTRFTCGCTTSDLSLWKTTAIATISLLVVCIMGIVGLLSALHVRQRDTQQLYFRYRRLSQKKTGDSRPATTAEDTLSDVRSDGTGQRIQDSARVGNECLRASDILPSVTEIGDFEDEDAYAKPLDTYQQGRSSSAVDEAQPTQVAVKASGEHTHVSDLAKRSTFMIGVTKTQQRSMKSKSLPREERISSFTYPEPPHKARTCCRLDGLVETLPEDPKDRMQDVVPYMSTSNSNLQVNRIGQVPEVHEDGDIYEAADDTDYVEDEIYLNPDVRGDCSPSSSCYMAMV
eukprot:scpid69709/ scgid1677/ 